MKSTFGENTAEKGPWERAWKAGKEGEGSVTILQAQLLFRSELSALMSAPLRVSCYFLCLEALLNPFSQILEAFICS